MSLLRHVTGRTLWLLLGLAVAAVLLLRRDDASAIEAQWQDQVKSFAAYRWTVRGLEGQVAATVHGTQRLTDSLAHVQRRADSTTAALHRAFLDALAAVPAARTLVILREKCEAAIGESQQVNTLCRQRGDSLQRQDSLHQALYQLAASRSAHADSIIASGLRSVQCKFLLLLPCMSRSHALELGLLTGVVATLVLHR